MFNDHLVGKQAPPRPEFVILKSWHTEIYFFQKLKTSPLFILGQK